METTPLAVSEYVAHNRSWIDSYPGPSPLRPTRHVAIVACMDSRIDVFAALGLGHGEAHIIRNAGGVITDDVERSLAISQHKMGTREIILIHHSECGLQTFSDEEFKSELEASTGFRPQWSDENFTDVDESVRTSIRQLRASPFLVERNYIRGFVFDVNNGELREIVVS
jgi:carbonic anhydrase